MDTHTRTPKKPRHFFQDSGHYLYLDTIYLSTDTCLTSTLFGIDLLNIFSLLKRTLVATQTFLGIFVNALVGTASASFNHVQNASLVRGESHHFADDITSQRSSLGKDLPLSRMTKSERERIVKGGVHTIMSSP